MRRRLKETIVRRLRLKDSWVVFFILGLVMLNYPFLSIFDKPLLVAGLPLLYLYLQGGWLCAILVAYLFSRANERRKGEGEGT